MDRLSKAEAFLEKTIRERPECLDLEAILHLTDAEKIELAEDLEYMDKLKWAEALVEKTKREHPEYLALDEIPNLDDEEIVELAEALQRDEDTRNGKDRLLSVEETRRYLEGV